MLLFLDYRSLLRRHLTCCSMRFVIYAYVYAEGKQKASKPVLGVHEIMCSRDEFYVGDRQADCVLSGEHIVPWITQARKQTKQSIMTPSTTRYQGLFDSVAMSHCQTGSA